MSSTHVVFGDAHASPKHNNNRALALGKFIHAIRPDAVIDLGDTADMESLCSYDKGRRSAIGRTYAADIASHAEFQDMLWHPYKQSKRRHPLRIRLIGNHEQRIEKAVDLQPELLNTISLKDLDLDRYYDEVIPYQGGTPGIIEVDGIDYSHYLVSGSFGRPISGRHHAFSLLQSGHRSATVGHSHVFDFAVQKARDGKSIMGLVAPAFLDYSPSWVGYGASSWSSGAVVKRGVEGGRYDLEFVSIERIMKEYGGL